jgi:DNA-binding response OmpR family regulator
MVRDARILIVESDTLTRKLLTITLRSAGYRRIRAVSTNAAAVEWIAKMPPDLVLLDLEPPAMEGLQLARHLRMAPQTERTPILAVSSDDRRSTVVRARAAGCDELLSVPISSLALAARERLRTSLRPETRPGQSVSTGALP